MSVLLEKILDRNNMNLAYKKIYANKGASGVDGVTLEELKDYIKENWNRIAQEIRERKYKPLPVRRVEIPKPNGGVRQLGIPTVMDRVIQQAIVQVISPIAEPYFSECLCQVKSTPPLPLKKGPLRLKKNPYHMD
ncbi:hypothetical protein LJC02_04175 [Breznakia sp. OttesenSCG-928-G09]|nr:hypothetical protein [Breznakia sp. OttesenSCG-928-G09]